MKVRILDKGFVELPKYTLAVVEKLEEYEELENQAKNGKVKAVELYQAQYDLLNYLLGEEKTCEILLTDNLEEIDLQNLTIALMDIRTAYAQPVIDKQLETFKNTLGKAKGELDLVNKLNV